jgi:hypothetical protein
MNHTQGGAANKKKKKGKATSAISVGAVAAAVAHLEGPSHVLGAPAAVLRTFVSTLLPPPPASNAGDNQTPAQVQGSDGAGDAGGSKGRKKNKGAGDEGDASEGIQAVLDSDAHMQDADNVLSFDLPAALDVFASA